MPRPRRPADGAGLAGLAALTGFAVLTALTLSACTTAPDEPAGTAFVTPSPPGGSSSSADGGDAAPAPDEDATAADVAFLEAMVAHHEQAVELAGLAAARAADVELADLANRMHVTQAAEAASMQSWLERRIRDGGSADHDHDVTMRGEISRSTLDRAAELDGPAFDELFLAVMVAHHRGAVEMAEARLAEAGDPALARWARAIATAQALEIDRMLDIKARLSDSGS
ncbi:hypothetical protein GCM10023152_01010 [Agromyces bauzanensis]|uniref:DUF305 domain-containing protein n=2 Tax=Agromyces bauzanensis TaxID=1308924 RepID=A0A917UR44_9MICO|nr:hypothetical protein GCM10011372_17030 [Agromyces bauzanensis]